VGTCRLGRFCQAGLLEFSFASPSRIRIDANNSSRNPINWPALHTAIINHLKQASRSVCKILNAAVTAPFARSSSSTTASGPMESNLAAAGVVPSVVAVWGNGYAPCLAMGHLLTLSRPVSLVATPSNLTSPRPHPHSRQLKGYGNGYVTRKEEKGSGWPHRST
jgi:hypothetical protein